MCVCVCQRSVSARSARVSLGGTPPRHSARPLGWMCGAQRALTELKRRRTAAGGGFRDAALTRLVARYPYGRDRHCHTGDRATIAAACTIVSNERCCESRVCDFVSVVAVLPCLSRSAAWSVCARGCPRVRCGAGRARDCRGPCGRGPAPRGVAQGERHTPRAPRVRRRAAPRPSPGRRPVPARRGWERRDRLWCVARCG